MLAGGESRNTVVRPDGNGAVTVDSQGARITSDPGFLSRREIATGFRTIHTMGFRPDDFGIPHSYQAFLSPHGSSKRLPVSLRLGLKHATTHVFSAQILPSDRRLAKTRSLGQVSPYCTGSITIFQAIRRSLRPGQRPCPGQLTRLHERTDQPRALLMSAA